MKPVVSLIGLGLTLACAWPASAQQGPRIKEMKPGKYAYSIDMQNPGMPMKMPPMSFSQCVTPKDMDEGRAFQAQKDAGVNCTYSNANSSAGHFQFSASCKMQGGMSMEADYDGTVAGDVITMQVKQKMQGGQIPDNMRNSTMKMVMTRQGDC
jgi:hypothetical protein